MYNKNYFILTGGPGSGKTTVLKELRAMGYLTVEEAAREIIRKQVLSEGNAVPWGDLVKYSELMRLRSVLDYLEYAHVTAPCFFDRGIPDTFAYNKLTGMDVNNELKRAVSDYRYNKNVFLFRPREDIYVTDDERKQDFETAVRTYQVIKESYRENGYVLTEVPFLPPKERAKWVSEFITNPG
ncbi:MAG: AAA family ATPase [Bacteroidales bacterium]|nr:AAA family ATPase [Bacteroidales bacterium]